MEATRSVPSNSGPTWTETGEPIWPQGHPGNQYLRASISFSSTGAAVGYTTASSNPESPLAGNGRKRGKSLPAFKPPGRKVDAAAATAEPPQFKGHLWKKSPGLSLFKYQWRYVVIRDARIYWWASVTASGHEEPKGLVDFTDNMCDVFPDELDQRKFILIPRTGRWHRGSFTGAQDGRTFRFDCHDSEFNRVSWLQALDAHIKYGEAKRRRAQAKLKLTSLLAPGADLSVLDQVLREGIDSNVDRPTLEFIAQQLNVKLPAKDSSNADSSVESRRSMGRSSSLKQLLSQTTPIERRLPESPEQVQQASQLQPEAQPSDIVEEAQERQAARDVQEAQGDALQLDTACHDVPAADSGRTSQLELIHATVPVVANNEAAESGNLASDEVAEVSQIADASVANVGDSIPNVEDDSQAASLAPQAPEANSATSTAHVDAVQAPEPSSAPSTPQTDSQQGRNRSDSSASFALKRPSRRLSTPAEDGPVWTELKAKLEKRRSQIIELDDDVVKQTG